MTPIAVERQHRHSLPRKFNFASSDSKARTGVSSVPAKTNLMGKKAKETKMEPNITDIASQTLSMARSKHGVASDGIAYSVGTSTFGNILVARDAQGVCAILIGSGPEELTSDLAKRFPQSELARDDRELDDDLQKVLRFVETPSSGLTLELAMHGTPFQQRVWEELIKVPPGRIITYAALAARIGQPTAVRAVANACAANAIALAIPCHRVVRSNGALSGYRWGVERKRALLEKEAQP
jgi:methylated-DNA-[protein]-cysteine S-methyltransferase/AraC family transcriptional regulator of adaptative response/methylated-DNA-[protein]-cysteine methyltransferase